MPDGRPRVLGNVINIILKDKNANVREAAAVAAGRLDEPTEAVPALTALLKNEKDMTVRAVSRFAGSGRKDAGPRPTDDLQPQPVSWVQK